MRRYGNQESCVRSQEQREATQPPAKRETSMATSAQMPAPMPRFSSSTRSLTVRPRAKPPTMRTMYSATAMNAPARTAPQLMRLRTGRTSEA